MTWLSEREWVAAALGLVGRRGDPGPLAAALAAAAGDLDRPGMDADAGRHREVYFEVFDGLGIDAELAGALYRVESDPGWNAFAVDAAETVAGLRARGVRVVVVSDVHMDIRPAFAAAGVVVDGFTLSFEVGAQKPDPRVFEHALGLAGVGAGEALMVGDRSGPDGGAVECGIATLLVPPLTDPRQRRLGLVSRVV